MARPGVDRTPAVQRQDGYEIKSSLILQPADRLSRPGFPPRAGKDQSRDKSDDGAARTNRKHRRHAGEHEITDRHSKQRYQKSTH